MCGIFGSFAIDGEPVDAKRGEICTDTLVHRGPDEGGTWSEDSLFLGMRRLSILDLEAGNQPIWDSSKRFCIVYNGELYNYRELRSTLQAQGYALQTKSDTEVVLNAFVKWGPQCLQRLNGMFAFAVWNRRERSLFISRDRLGEKPLYYFWDRKRLVFASEMKAIVADPTIEREIDFQGLFNYLSFGSSLAPTTIFRNISKLQPGHYLEVSTKGLSLHEYWDVPRQTEPHGKGSAFSAETIRELLADSVRMRMVSDVPLGAFLSGGVDSSAIVAYMTRFSEQPIKTFSLGFPAHRNFSELDDARLVAKYFGTDHYELELDHVDVPEIFENLAYQYDEPFFDPAKIPVYLLSQFARQHVKVALGGEGADELFGGYRRYAADQLSNVYRGLLPGSSALETLLSRLPRMRRMKTAVRTLGICSPGRRYANWLLVFWPDALRELVSEELIRELGQHDTFAHYEDLYGNLGSETAHLNRLLYVDLKSWLPNTYLEKTDKASMAASLEVRLPFLDHRLVEFAFRIPPGQKIRTWNTKIVLKEALKGVLPRHVLKKRKHGFSVPTDQWFRGDLAGYLQDSLTSSRARNRGYFDPRAVDTLIREHVSGRENWDAQLGLLLSFELWAQHFLDDRPRPETGAPDRSHVTQKLFTETESTPR